MKNGIKIQAPASIGNFAVGFDVLGAAVNVVSDEIVAYLNPDIKGVHITKIFGDSKKNISKETHLNTAGVAGQKLLDHLNLSDTGIEMEIHKKIGIGTGLGSSAASACAGVMAVNELLKRPLEKRALLDFATIGEQVASGDFHCDNTAPILLGSIQLYSGINPLRVRRVALPRGLSIVLLYPKIVINTKDSRTTLKEHITLKEHAYQSANLGNFIIGMERSDIVLIKESLKDLIIEPQRANHIPNFYQVKDAAMQQGALGCSISGAGPTMFALCQNNIIGEAVGLAMQDAFKASGIESKLWITTINTEGTIKC